MSESKLFISCKLLSFSLRLCVKIEAAAAVAAAFRFADSSDSLLLLGDDVFEFGESLDDDDEDGDAIGDDVDDDDADNWCC